MLVDRAAARVLGHKLDLGLHSPARLLPLARPPATIALIGSCADDARTSFGCYSFPNHVLPSFPELGNGIEALTLREALAAELPASRISYHAGCAVSGSGTDHIAEAVTAARQADICILAVGDRPGMFGHGTSGEGCDAPDLTLRGVQGELADAVLATGTPTVLVVISGRPYALGRSGKLPVQVPRHRGINPATYLHPILAGDNNNISSLDPTPQFPFGHGLSYTRFDYTGLHTSAAAIDTAGAITLSVTISNTGDQAGDEIVQLYFSAPVASVTRPVKQLLGFARLSLGCGESRTVSFDIHTDRFAFIGTDLKRTVEPGTIELQVGSSSTDIRSRAELELTGPARAVQHKRQMTTEARIN